MARELAALSLCKNFKIIKWNSNVCFGILHHFCGRLRCCYCCELYTKQPNWQRRMMLMELQMMSNVRGYFICLIWAWFGLLAAAEGVRVRGDNFLTYLLELYMDWFAENNKEDSATFYFHFFLCRIFTLTQIPAIGDATQKPQIAGKWEQSFISRLLFCRIDWMMNIQVQCDHALWNVFLFKILNQYQEGVEGGCKAWIW